MKTCLSSVSVVVVLLTASARADTVFLQDGTILENVKARTKDGKVVAATELGERVFPADRVRSVNVVEHFGDKDELTRRHDATSDDVEEMRTFVSWCDAHGFHKEGRSAWRAWLDRRLAACSKAGDYVDLAWKMNVAGFSDGERRRVLQMAKKLDPENDGARRALTQLRGGERVEEPDSDVPFDERGLTADGRAQAQAHKAAAAKEREHLTELAVRVAEEDKRHEDAFNQARQREETEDRQRFFPVGDQGVSIIPGTGNGGQTTQVTQLGQYGQYGQLAYAPGIDPTTGATLVPWYALPGARGLSRVIDPTTGLPFPAGSLVPGAAPGVTVTAVAQARVTVTPRPVAPQPQAFAPAPSPLRPRSK